MPVSFQHRVVGSSIVARWVPQFFKNGLDNDAVEGAAGPYDFANLLVDWVRAEPPAGLLTGWWRGVGVTHNAFVVEGFVDELAAAAGKDPVDYRRALLTRRPAPLAVLDLAAAQAGWGQPLPAGKGRGRVGHRPGSAAMSPRWRRSPWRRMAAFASSVWSARWIAARWSTRTRSSPRCEGGIMYGLTAALYGEITLKDGRVEQSNFDTYQALRIDEAPKVEVHIVPSGKAPGGIGEPGTATIAPAVVNAIFAATGKRLRKLPIDAGQLKSA